MVPLVQVTAALASTAKLDPAVPPPPPPLPPRPSRSARRGGLDGALLDGPLESVLHAAASAANAVMTASRAVRRGRVNMVPPSIWCEHRCVPGSMSLADPRSPTR